MLGVAILIYSFTNSILLGTIECLKDFGVES